MNCEFKKFLIQITQLGDEDLKKYNLAFSCKVTKDKVVSDRVCAIFRNISCESLLSLIHLITINEKIDEWFQNIFLPGKTVIISFTENKRKIYIENKKELAQKTRLLNQSIEWEVGSEDDFKHRDYNLSRQKPDDFKTRLPPQLYPYLNFDQCLLRTDGQLYIRHSNNNGQLIRMNRDLGINFMKMFCELQGDNMKKNIVQFRNWLLFAEKRNAIFNWCQIDDDNFSVYIC